ncbi:MAG: hypothetical protein ACRD3L_01480 [Terriglobales bacterium]
MQIEITLRNELAVDLEAQAKNSHCSVRDFAEQLLEAEVAARRLPSCHSPGAAHGALRARDESGETND